MSATDCSPQSSCGRGTRRSNEAEPDTLRRLGALIADGINLTGVGVILVLETRNAILAERIAQLAHIPAEDSASERISRIR